MVMSKRTNTVRAKSTVRDDKKSFEQLFEERNKTQPGSREEEQATQKILESVFPDPNAGQS